MNNQIDRVEGPKNRRQPADRRRILLVQTGAWWRAWWADKPSAFAEGTTPAQAIGQLILDYPDHEQITIERK
jgi:hypothetical protein